MGKHDVEAERDFRRDCRGAASDCASHAHVALPVAPGVEEFQVLVDRDWQQRYCLGEDGTAVVGPTKISGANWRAEIPDGCRWLRVVWYPGGNQCHIDWSYLGASGQRLSARGRSKRA